MATIFDQYLKPVRSVAEYQADYDTQESNKLKLMLARQGMADKQREAADEQALRNAHIQSGGDRNKLLNILQQGGQHKAIESIRKSLQADDKAAADLAQTKSNTAAKDFETRQKMIDAHGSGMKWLADNPTYENAIALRDHFKNMGVMSAEQLQQGFSKVEANPTPENIKNLAMMGYQSSINAEKQLVKESNINQGGYQSVGSFNPVTGQRTEASRQTITESEAERLRREQQGAHQKVTEAQGWARLSNEDKNAKEANKIAAAGPTEFEKELGKQDAKQLDAYRDAADKAQTAISRVQAMRNAVKNGVYSGAWADKRTDAANFFATLGAPGIDKAKLANSQEYQKHAKELTLSVLKEGVGSNNISNADLAFVDATVPQLSTDPEARKRILDYIEQRSQGTVSKFKAADEYGRSNRSLRGFSQSGQTAPNNPNPAKPTVVDFGSLK